MTTKRVKPFGWVNGLQAPGRRKTPNLQRRLRLQGAARRLSALWAPLVLLVSGCQATPPVPTQPPPTLPAPGAVSRIEITPGAVLLTASGEGAQLSARAVDQSGREVDTEFTWRSSHPSRVEVDGDGFVSAVTDVGSAQIVAQAQSVESIPALALVAQPVAGAVLISDDQIVTPPDPIDPGQEPHVGAQYRVTLSGTPSLTAGTIVIAKESAPVAGRVLSAEPGTAGTEVVVETRPLAEVFENLLLELAFDLRQADVRVTAERAAETTLHYESGGTLRLKMRPMSPLAALGPDDVKFDLGPFECELDTAPVLDLDELIELEIERALRVPIVIDIQGRRLERFSMEVVGTVAGRLIGGPKFTAAFSGTLTCTGEFLAIPIPIGGPVSAIIAPVVPLGMGFDVEGTLQVATFEARLAGQAGAQAELGFAYTADGGFSGKRDFSVGADVRTVLDWPGRDDFRLSAGVYVYGWAELAVGNPALERILTSPPRLSVVKARFGPRMELDAATRRAQAGDPDYASSYGFGLAGEAGLGSDLQQLFNLVVAGIEVSLDLSVTYGLTLASSPFGVLSAEALAVPAGDSVDFVVEFDDEWLEFPLIGYNVAEVEIHRQREGRFELMETLSGRLGQQSFEWSWEAPAGETGEHTFYAFVTTHAIPGIAWEIAEDSSVAVTVGEKLVLSADPASGVVPLDTTFTWEGPDSTLGPLQCTLDPGDGTPAYMIDDCGVDTSQRHTYLEDGTYVAGLTASGEGFEESANTTVRAGYTLVATVEQVWSGITTPGFGPSPVIWPTSTVVDEEGLIYLLYSFEPGGDVDPHSQINHLRLAVSEDGGLSFTHQDISSSDCLFFREGRCRTWEKFIGPRMAVGLQGESYAAFGRFWSSAAAAPPTLPDLDDEDPRFAEDVAVAPDGTVYVASNGMGHNEVRIRRSTDQGRSFSAPVTVATLLEDHPSAGARIAVGPDGEIHVVWGEVLSGGPAGNDPTLFYSRSTDGGETFSPRRLLSNDVIEGTPRTFDMTMGENGVLGVAYATGWGGDSLPQLRYQQVVDGEVSPPRQIAQTSESYYMFFPSLAIDPAGTVSVLWRTARDDPADGLNVSVSDDGRTFQTHSFVSWVEPEERGDPTYVGLPLGLAVDPEGRPVATWRFYTEEDLLEVGIGARHLAFAPVHAPK